jgi:hypothetical protein
VYTNGEEIERVCNHTVDANTFVGDNDKLDDDNEVNVGDFNIEARCGRALVVQLFFIAPYIDHFSII